MSRADYLSKYLSGPEEKKKKKKSKKGSSATNVAVIVGGVHSMKDEVETQDALLATAQDGENEYLPAKVELPIALKENKGFKRIDNGQISKPMETQTVAKEQPKTVYRDQSGRIIDLDTKRQEMKEKAEKKALEDEQLRDQINTGDLDKLSREEKSQAESEAKRFAYSTTDKQYVDHMKSRRHFEDPMALFETTDNSRQETTTKTGRPVYNEGIHPSNRFNIKAGYFWDGIDRSNGFEDRLLEKRNQQYVQKVTTKASLESYTEYDFE